MLADLDDFFEVSTVKVAAEVIAEAPSDGASYIIPPAYSFEAVSSRAFSQSSSVGDDDSFVATSELRVEFASENEVEVIEFVEANDLVDEFEMTSGVVVEVVVVLVDEVECGKSAPLLILIFV